jgi:opacity protein-like surface antigen
MSLDVGQFSRSTTIDFVDVVPNWHFVFAAHAETNWQAWTGFLDLLYMSVGQSETQNGVSVSTGLQQGFFEFGATYRLGPVSLGRAGRLTFEPLAGGRFIWMHASLGFPNQKVSESASVIDPMIGGRLAYHIMDTVALWLRGDVAGFGISDNQTKLTYNLIAGLEWRFMPRASALVGWRYMDIELEKGNGSSTFNADIEMNGPFVGVNFHF